MKLKFKEVNVIGFWHPGYMSYMSYVPYGNMLNSRLAHRERSPPIPPAPLRDCKNRAHRQMLARRREPTKNAFSTLSEARAVKKAASLDWRAEKAGKHRRAYAPAY